MNEKPESPHRDTKVLTLLALRVTKAFLVAMKEEYDVPQGRLLDQAVEELAVRLMGQKKVDKIKRAMRDPAKKEILTREPRDIENVTADTGQKVRKRSANSDPMRRRPASRQRLSCRTFALKIGTI
jgi:hypothetical protein